jgi:hypothetical protein
MFRRKHLRSSHRPQLQPNRRGNIVVLSAAFMVGIMGITAFAIDIGYIAMVRAQLNVATDGSALSAALELSNGLGPGSTPTQTTVASNAKTAASSVAAANAAGDKSSVFINTDGDVRFGRRTMVDGVWTNSWGTQPYNLVEIIASRGAGGSGNGDTPLPLFFARVLGHNTADLAVTSRAALLAGVGFEFSANSNLTRCPILPITFDLETWDKLMLGISSNNAGGDNYAYSNGAVGPGSDGVLEFDLYPYGNQSLTPGNRGTVKIGVTNNSTATLSDQIRYGVSKAQLETIGGSIEIEPDCSITLGGNPGLSAAIKDDLTAIIGETRAIPIFTSVSGPGNNAQYTIVKFVGIRILFVQLTGGNKRVIAQPAVLISETVIPGDASSSSTFVYTKPRLVN